MKKVILFLVLIAVLCCPVIAESISVDLIYDEFKSYSLTSSLLAGAAHNANPSELHINWDLVSNPTDFIVLTSAFNVPNDAGTITYTGTNGASFTADWQYTNGSFSGYTQQFYLHFTSFTKGTKTGTEVINLATLPGGSRLINSNSALMYYSTLVGSCPMRLSNLAYVQHPIYAYYLLNDNEYAKNTITADDNGGSTLVTVDIDRLGYTSVIRALSGTTTVYTSSSGNYDISGVLLPNKPLTFSAYMLGHFVNSSEYFTTGAGVTATAKTYVQNVNGQTNGAIHGSAISIKNDVTGVWTNASDLSDGTHYIVTNASDTISAYGVASGFVSASRTGLTPFNEGLYELIMWPVGSLPTPADGKVNLIVVINDRSTSAGIYMAGLTVTSPTGDTYAGYTNDAGTKIFQVNNNSVILVSATKTGYTSASKSLTTTDFGPDTIRIELDKTTVTPTVTIPTPIVTDSSGNPITPAPTVNPRDSWSASQKDESMMNVIRDNGESLIMFFILMVVLYFAKGLMKW